MFVMVAAAFAAAQAVTPGALIEAAANGPSAIEQRLQRVKLSQDTPVELMALNEVSTATARPGTVFKLRVNRAIVIDGKTVVPVGSLAFGRVESAIDAGGLGKSGRMTAKLLHMRVGDQEIPLEGDVSAKGRGAGSAGVAFLFGGVVGLFHRGNNARIKAGEIVAAFVAKDVDLEDAGSAVQSPAPQTPAHL